jgi:hypothetical protein
MGVHREGKFGNNILHAEWNAPARERTITYSFHVTRKDMVTKDFPEREETYSRKEFEKFLSSTSLGATGGAAKEYADRITRGKKTILAKATAIYDWTVENMFRDPDAKGCGLGEVDVLLRKMGGKCADIHSVYVTWPGAGIPGGRCSESDCPKEGRRHDEGAALLGRVHLPGSGGRRRPGRRAESDPREKITLEEAALREYYFGAVDENRIAFGTGRDLKLNPPQRGEPLNYFMYPYAEADGKPLNEDLYGFNLGYTIGFREL